MQIKGVWGTSPTSILQRKKCFCIDENIACHNNTTFQSVFNCFLFYRNFQKYQLSHIRGGKSHIQKSPAVWKPELERYTGLVQQIKEKSKERKALVAEKKELPVYHVKRHKALTVRIAGLTEDLEELRSEKALLLQKFEYGFEKDYPSFEAFSKAIADYIDYYNNSRIQAKTKWMPPSKFREASMMEA